MAIPSFPSLVGQALPLTRSTIWKTLTQESVSGKETRVPLWTFPRYQWTVPFSVIRSATTFAELQALMGFVNSLMGGALPFYFTDPADNAVVNQPFGTGDGSTKTFQLVRSLGGNAEPVQSVNGAPTISVAGTPTTSFAVSSAGIVTFTAAPGLNQALSWSGAYQWLCRLDNDSADFSMFMSGFWEMKKLSWTSIKL